MPQVSSSEATRRPQAGAAESRQLQGRRVPGRALQAQFVLSELVSLGDQLKAFQFGGPFLTKS